MLDSVFCTFGILEYGSEPNRTPKILLRKNQGRCSFSTGVSPSYVPMVPSNTQENKADDLLNKGPIIKSVTFLLQKSSVILDQVNQSHTWTQLMAVYKGVGGSGAQEAYSKLHYNCIKLVGAH